MSNLTNADNKNGNAGTGCNDDMTVRFISGVELHYNDTKKAYDLNIWHGNINAFLHDAELCLQKLRELSDKDPGLLIKWAKDGLVTLTRDGRIDYVKYSICGVDATFVIKADGRYIDDKQAESAWKKFLFNNYEAICNLLVSGVCTEYKDWLSHSVEVYKTKEDKVVFLVKIDPWMIRTSFDVMFKEYDKDKFLHLFMGGLVGVGFYIYAGEENAHFYRYNYELKCTEEFTTPVPKDLSDMLRKIVE